MTKASLTFWAVLSFGPTLTATYGGAVFYTDQPSFETAASSAGLPSNTIDFESVPTGSYNTSAGLTVDGINFVGPISGGSYLLLVGAPFFTTGTGNTLTGQQEIDVTLDPDTYAFGANVGASFVSITGVSSTITFDLSNGDSDSVAITSSSLFPFFGFVSTVPISGVDITGPSFVTMDDVITGTMVPEPPSLWLAALPISFLACGLMCKRRKA